MQDTTVDELDELRTDLLRFRARYADRLSGAETRAITEVGDLLAEFASYEARR